MYTSEQRSYPKTTSIWDIRGFFFFKNQLHVQELFHSQDEATSGHLFPSPSSSLPQLLQKTKQKTLVN